MFVSIVLCVKFYIEEILNAILFNEKNTLPGRWRLLKTKRIRLLTSTNSHSLSPRKQQGNPLSMLQPAGNDRPRHIHRLQLCLTSLFQVGLIFGVAGKWEARHQSARKKTFKSVNSITMRLPRLKDGLRDVFDHYSKVLLEWIRLSVACMIKLDCVIFQ